MASRRAGVGDSIEKARDGSLEEALRFTGDRLVCLVGPDGFTMMTEKARTAKGGYRFLTRRSIPTDEARLIAESFTGEVVWK